MLKTVIYPICNGNYTDSSIPMLMSLRSVERFLKEDVTVIVISEKEPMYLSDEVIYVKCESYRNALDIATTLADEFLWMNDDIMLLKDWTWDELRVWRRGKSEVSEEKQDAKINSNGAWNARKGRVMKQLREEGHTTYDFSTHTPYLYNSAILADVLSRFDYGYKTPVETAYGNVSGCDHELKSGVLSRHHDGALPIDISSYGLLNFDDVGLTEHMVGFLLGMFPTPSKYEDMGTCDPSKLLTSRIK